MSLFFAGILFAGPLTLIIGFCIGLRVSVRWMAQADERARRNEADARFWFNEHHKLSLSRREKRDDDGADWWKEAQ